MSISIEATTNVIKLGNLAPAPDTKITSTYDATSTDFVPADEARPLNTSEAQNTEQTEQVVLITHKRWGRYTTRAAIALLIVGGIIVIGLVIAYTQQAHPAFGFQNSTAVSDAPVTSTFLTRSSAQVSFGGALTAAITNPINAVLAAAFTKALQNRASTTSATSSTKRCRSTKKSGSSKAATLVSVTSAESSSSTQQIRGRSIICAQGESNTSDPERLELTEYEKECIPVIDRARFLAAEDFYKKALADVEERRLGFQNIQSFIGSDQMQVAREVAILIVNHITPCIRKFTEIEITTLETEINYYLCVNFRINGLGNVTAIRNYSKVFAQRLSEMLVIQEEYLGKYFGSLYSFQNQTRALENAQREASTSCYATKHIATNRRDKADKKTENCQERLSREPNDEFVLTAIRNLYPEEISSRDGL